MRTTVGCRLTPTQLLSTLGSLDIQRTDQKEIGLLVEQLNKRIANLREELKEKQRQVRSIKIWLPQLAASRDKASLEEMEREVKLMQEEVQSLYGYRGELTGILRSREGAKTI